MDWLEIDWLNASVCERLGEKQGVVTPRDVLLVGWPRNTEVKAGREVQTNYFVASHDNKKNAAAAWHRIHMHAHIQPLPLRRTGERTANEAL